MNEPTLEQISDYRKLSGEKRSVVRAVIITGLLLGALYAIVANSYVGHNHDVLPVDDSILVLPFNP